MFFIRVSLCVCAGDWAVAVFGIIRRLKGTERVHHEAYEVKERRNKVEKRPGFTIFRSVYAILDQVILRNNARTRPLTIFK